MTFLNVLILVFGRVSFQLKKNGEHMVAHAWCLILLRLLGELLVPELPVRLRIILNNLTCFPVHAHTVKIFMVKIFFL